LARLRFISLCKHEQTNLIAHNPSSYKGQTVLCMDRAVAYYRISTKQQHRSGLGIEARAAVTRFAEAEGLTIIAEFVEAETGKGRRALDRRPQLAAALAKAKAAKCCVVVSKLDRLSRDVAFVSGLMAQRCPSSWLSWAVTPIRPCCTSTLRWPRGAPAYIRANQGGLSREEDAGCKVGQSQKPACCRIYRTQGAHC
jgi:hypothetical protein